MRALIIGTGSIGQRHMRNLRAIAPDTEFVLWRRDRQSLDGWGEAAVVTEFGAAWEHKPDFAILANPSARHYDSLELLISASIPTYVEKPVVTTHAQVGMVRQALRKFAGVPHAAGFNLRHLPSMSTARAIVAGGELGSIVRAGFTAGQWLPDWRKGQDHRQSYSAQRSQGGGVLFDLSHEFDAARLFLGEMSMLAAASDRVEALGIESEGVAVAIARSSSGTLASISLDYVSRQPVRRYELVGVEGTVVWDLALRRLSVSSSSGHTEHATDPGDFDVAQTYETAMKQFLAAVRTGSLQGLQDLEDGLRSTELAISAHPEGTGK